jgi:hypothetical protein
MVESTQPVRDLREWFPDVVITTGDEDTSLDLNAVIAARQMYANSAKTLAGCRLARSDLAPHEVDVLKLDSEPHALRTQHSTPPLSKPFMGRVWLVGRVGLEPTTGGL